MMMPANFSAISAEEMTYVNGGDNFLGLPGELSTLTTNVINIVANSYVGSLTSYTLGRLFSPTYKFGDFFKGIGDFVTGDYAATDADHKTSLNETSTDHASTWGGAAMTIVGGLAAIGQLMYNDTKVYTKEKLIGINGAM